jgi:hypothetical protein
MDLAQQRHLGHRPKAAADQRAATLRQMVQNRNRRSTAHDGAS